MITNRQKIRQPTPTSRAARRENVPFRWRIRYTNAPAYHRLGHLPPAIAQDDGPAHSETRMNAPRAGREIPELDKDGHDR